MLTGKRKRRVNPLQIIIGYAIGMVMVLAGVYLATLTPVGPLSEVLPYMEGDEQVTVTHDKYASFQPVKSPANIGLIFYPGGRVDYRSYAPLARGMAEKGWPVAIVPMPLNLAVLGADRASWVIHDHPEIQSWVIGGHSLGGTMAAQYALKNPGEFAGIIFMASFPDGKNLAASKIPVLSIYGSEDGLIKMDDWQKYQDRFPSATRWVNIEGGNHAGFGWYGIQEGDNPASISLQDQTGRIIQAVDEFMRTLEDSPE